MIRTKALAGLLVIPLLCGCGSIGDKLDFRDIREDFQGRRDRLQARSNTAYVAVPDSGSVTFRGEASLALGKPGYGIAMLGDAIVIVDFQRDSVSGTLSGFSGFDSNEDFANYSGELLLEDGILGAGNPNDVEARIAGTLRSPDTIIDVDALWEGHLKGTPIIGFLGDTTGSQSTFERNGQRVPGGIVIAVTN